MRKYVPKILQALALIMFVGGIILFVVCQSQAWESGLGYYTRDREAVVFWKFLSYQCIGMAISSIFVVGLSYIVQAACLYIEKREQEIFKEQMEQEIAHVE